MKIRQLKITVTALESNPDFLRFRTEVIHDGWITQREINVYQNDFLSHIDHYFNSAKHHITTLATASKPEASPAHAINRSPGKELGIDPTVLPPKTPQPLNPQPLAEPPDPSPALQP